MSWWRDRFELLFWPIAKSLIRMGYGYEEKDKRDGMAIGTPGRCATCAASEVQDWIDEHLQLVRDFK